MTSGVAILLIVLGLGLVVVAARGTYADVMLLVLHPSKGSEATGSTMAEPNPVGKEAGNNQHE